MAPGVSLAECRDDLRTADADGNQRITRTEFVTFLETFGERVCYERPGNTTELAEAESFTFDTLVCLATAACEDLSEILVAEPAFTPTFAFTLCTITYSSAMNGPECDGRDAPTTGSPTAAPVAPPPPTTPAPIQVPQNTESGASRRTMGGHGRTTVVVGAAMMLAYMWM